MIFTLEALQAAFGDSLLLHYGPEGAPKHILIDGGPGGVYKNTLRPRLEELRAQKTSGQLRLQMVMVSHIDRDHITGIISLTNELIALGTNKQHPYKIARLWHNSFDDFIKTTEPVTAALGASVQAASAGDELLFNPALNPSSLAVVADVRQGRDLRDNAVSLSLEVNSPFKKGIVVAPATGKKQVDLGDGLQFTIVGPNQKRVDDLQKEWDETLERLKLAKDAAAAEAIAADFLDDSVPNLSSIVVLAEMVLPDTDKKSMLLTGDARGDDIIAGLKNLGLMQNDTVHVNLLKVPHHGSDRNVSTDFFRAITADDYVISANGLHGNPDVSTLKMISEARGQSVFTIHLTNHEDRLEQFFAAEKESGKQYIVNFREPAARSVEVKLGV